MPNRRLSAPTPLGLRHSVFYVVKVLFFKLKGFLVSLIYPLYASPADNSLLVSNNSLGRVTYGGKRKKLFYGNPSTQTDSHSSADIFTLSTINIISELSFSSSSLLSLSSTSPSRQGLLTANVDKANTFCCTYR